MPSQTLYCIPKGTVIIKENDLDPRAYYIQSGSVEILKTRGGRQVRLAVLGPGQTFGEIGLILERPRTASVVAMEDAEILSIEMETFNRLMLEDPKKVLPFIRTLFEHLRTMNMRILEDTEAEASAEGQVLRRETSATTPETKTARPSGGSPVLTGKTPQAKTSLEGKGVPFVLKISPFKIGRKSGGRFIDILSYNDLTLVDRSPYNVSQNHCSINRRTDGKGYYVQDRGSSLGTIVNGRRIGGNKTEGMVDLDRETNTLVLGGHRSPFCYEITFKFGAA